MSRAPQPRQAAWRSRSLWVLGVAFFSAGCVKRADSPAPEAPSAPESERAPSAAEAPSAGEQDARLVLDDEGSEGSGPRPEISARAKQAQRAGLRAFFAGDLAGAKAQLRAATAADGNAYRAYYSLGVVEERLGARAEALAAYQRALEIVPDYEHAAAAWAILSAREGEHARATQELESRLARLPSSAPLTTALAEVKSMQGASGDAQRLAQEALKKNPDYRPAMVTLARDHYRRRRLDLALYTLQGILDGYGAENPPRDKNNAEARLLRGLIYRERNLRGPAIDELTRAIQLRPDLVEARLHLAAYMLEAGNAEGALPHLEAAVRFDSKNILARLNLGDAYRLLGRPAEARRELEWVAKAAPERPEVHYNLGLLYLLSKDIPGVTPIQAATRAIEHLEKYQSRGVRGGPDDAVELITRARTNKALLEAQAQEAKAVQAEEQQP